MNLFQPGHLLVILIIVLIIFGPGKLPQVGRGFGQMISDFRKSASRGFGSEEE
ncbi:MAG: twin-arginine translocase TatA/TatE family subunit [Candidatus Saccharibacteria bacterium]